MEREMSHPKMDWSAEDLPTAFKAFKAHCEFMFGGPLRAKTEEEKCNYLMLWVGEKGRSIYSTWEITDEGRKKLKTYFDAFEQYCKPRSNAIYARYRLRQRVQSQTEPFEQFVTDLKVKIKDCGYPEAITDEMVRDHIVFGIADNAVREKFIREGSDLTLQKTIDIGRTYEMSQKQLKHMTDQNESARVHVDLLRHKQRPRNTKREKRQEKPTTERTFDCSRCGTKHAARACPAFGKKCMNCKKPNHFARQCKSKALHELHEPDDSTSDPLFVGELKVHEVTQTDTEKAWFSVIKVEGRSVKFKLDTGAEANVLPESIFHKLQHGPLRKTQAKLSTYGNTGVIKPVGKSTLTCKTSSDNREKLDFFVVDFHATPILGFEACKKLKLVEKIDVISQPVTHRKRTTRSSLLSDNEAVFSGLGKFEGQYHIEIDKTVKPVVNPPRKVPETLLPKLKESLEQLEKNGVIAQVDKATDWVNSLVIVEKKNGKLRLCLDPRDLNKAVKREHFKIPTITDITARLSGKKVFTILDEKDGYHQVELDDESSYLCTFQTPFGRFRYKRLPFGISSASEVFQKKNIQTFGDIQGVHMITDDMIIAGADEAEHDEILQKVMNRAKEKNIKFNRDKIQFKVNEVKYMGCILGQDGMKPDPEKVKAIVQMPQPEDKKGVQRLLGTVNFLAPFIPNMSELTAPLRSVLKKDIAFVWDHEQTEAMEKIKAVLTETPVLKFYNVKKDVVIQTDASQNGLGSCLLQENHPVAYASRALTEAEKNYAQIEKELLAVQFACEKFNTYIYGKTVTVQTDHKPLEAIQRKQIHKAPPRLQRMLLRLQKYELTFQYTPGKYMYVADTLSRAFLEEKCDNAIEREDEIDIMIHTLVTNLPFSDTRLQKLRESLATDDQLQDLRKVVMDGWPHHKHALKQSVKPYWNFKEEIHIADNLLFVGDRIIIPSDQRQTVLDAVHESHLGIEKCKARARQSVYWPGMSKDIERICSQCETCNKFKRMNQKETLIQHEIPARPWQKVGIDIYEYKSQDYVLVVDYYSKFIETRHLKGKTAQAVVQRLKSIFSIHGIPEEIIADNMPFSSTAFLQFAKDYGIVVTTSSPTHSQSNGMAERSIQTVKNILKKATEEGKDEYMAMLEYRNTPITGCDYSPAQLLMSRMLRDKIPTKRQLLAPKVAVKARQKLTERQRRQKQYFDRDARDLKPLSDGDSVRYRVGKTWEPAVVTGRHSTPRSYLITTQNGQPLRRNRRHLLKTDEPRNDKPSILQDDEFPAASEQQTAATRSEQETPVTPVLRPRREIVRPARYRDENFVN